MTRKDKPINSKYFPDDIIKVHVSAGGTRYIDPADLHDVWFGAATDKKDKDDEPKDGSGKGLGGWQNLGCGGLLALLALALLIVEVLR